MVEGLSDKLQSREAMLSELTKPTRTEAAEVARVALIETQMMLEAIVRTQSTNFREVNERIMANRAALSASIPTGADPFGWVDGLKWHEQAHRAVMASVKLGAWMSAALDEPNVCDAMKDDIREWFSAGEPMETLGQAATHFAALTPTASDSGEVTGADRERAAKALGYKTVGDATDYRNTGAEDRAFEQMAKHFRDHRLGATQECSRCRG